MSPRGTSGKQGTATCGIWLGLVVWKHMVCRAPGRTASFRLEVCVFCGATEGSGLGNGPWSVHASRLISKHPHPNKGVPQGSSHCLTMSLHCPQKQKQSDGQASCPPPHTPWGWGVNSVLIDSDPSLWKPTCHMVNPTITNISCNHEISEWTSFDSVFACWPSS